MRPQGRPQASEPLWLDRQPLVLASKSKSRQALLEAAGIEVEVIPADIDERGVESRLLSSGIPLENLAAALAEAKAVAVSARCPQAYCLGADQILLIDGRLMHKPANRLEAARSIETLSGRTHCVVSAFCLVRAGSKVGADSDRAFLTMRPQDQKAITQYLDRSSPEVISSVGAYQIEGVGIHLFERIEGDHCTILGLPMLKLLAILRSEGLTSI